MVLKSRKAKYILAALALAGLLTYAVRARMDSDYQAGQTYEEWKRGYDEVHRAFETKSQEVISPAFDFETLEIIYVGPGPKYYSKLGHLFLRFFKSKPLPEEDLALSFLIDANDYEVDNWAAMWGGKYSIYPLIKPMSVQTYEYQKVENRTFTRYTVKLTNEQKQNLKNVLRDYIQDRKQLGSWAMWDNSCSNRTNEFLRAAGVAVPIPKGPQFLTPAMLVESYQKAGIISVVNN